MLVQLGQGPRFRAEGVACGRTALVDPRLDPIRLEERLHCSELRLFDAEGAPASAARSSGGRPARPRRDRRLRRGRRGGGRRRSLPGHGAVHRRGAPRPRGRDGAVRGAVRGEEAPRPRGPRHLRGGRPASDVARWDVRLALSPEALLLDRVPRGVPLPGGAASRRVAPLEDGRCEFDLARGGATPPRGGWSPPTRGARTRSASAARRSRCPPSPVTTGSG